MATITDRITAARGHLFAGNDAGYARAISAVYRSATGVRAQRMVLDAIASDGQEALFEARNGTLVAREGAVTVF